MAAPMSNRLIVFYFGLLSYVVFLATFLYAIGFVADLYVPRSIDGPRVTSLSNGLIVDLVLLAVFAIQHSAMARPTFKRWLTQYVPQAAERSMYVLAASLALVMVFSYWQPLGGVVWVVRQPFAVAALHILCALGWLLALSSTFLIDHFDLFGLRQAWTHMRSREYQPVEFRTPGPYRLVRHPLYVGFIFAFWSTPTMTATHLLFAVAMTLYILVAIPLEERDLFASLGESYRDYRLRVPMLVPFTRRTSKRRAVPPA